MKDVIDCFVIPLVGAALVLGLGVMMGLVLVEGRLSYEQRMREIEHKAKCDPCPCERCK